MGSNDQLKKQGGEDVAEWERQFDRLFEGDGDAEVREKTSGPQPVAPAVAEVQVSISQIVESSTENGSEDTRGVNGDGSCDNDPHGGKTKPAPPTRDLLNLSRRGMTPRKRHEDLDETESGVSPTPVIDVPLEDLTGDTADQIIEVVTGSHPSLKAMPVPAVETPPDSVPPTSDPFAVLDGRSDLATGPAVNDEQIELTIDLDLDGLDAPGNSSTPPPFLPLIYGGQDVPTATSPSDQTPAQGAQKVTENEATTAAEKKEDIASPEQEALDKLFVQCLALYREMNANLATLQAQIENFKWKDAPLNKTQRQQIFLSLIHQLTGHLARHVIEGRTNIVQTKIGHLAAKLSYNLVEVDPNTDEVTFNPLDFQRFAILQALLQNYPPKVAYEMLTDLFIAHADFSKV